MKKNRFFSALAVILLAPILSFAEPDAAPEVERMAGLARLWGGVKFSSPHLSLGDIDWDSALIRALPRVRAARTGEAYRAALEDLLAELGDPVTRLLARPPIPSTSPPEPEGSASNGPRQPFVERTHDGIAILTATDATQFGDDSQTWIQMFSDFQKAFEKAAGAERVLVDLRVLRGSPGYLFNMTVPRFFPRLLNRDVPLPPTRFLFHSGYPSQREATFAYHSDMCVRSGGVIRAQGRGLPVPGRIVILINQDSGDLYGMLHALQRSGAAVVIGEGETNPDAGIVTRELDLPHGLKARIRCAESLREDGGTGFRPALSVRESARRTGLELLRGERDWPGAAAEPPASPDGRSGFSVAENAYPGMDVPSRDFRMLALFRFWNVIDRFYPYKDLMDHDWDDILMEFIPRMDAADSARAYVLTLAELVARIQDSHGTLSSPVLAEYFGTHTPALRVDSVEGRTVVTRIADAALKERGLEKGDILTSVDDEPVDTRRERLARLIPASTPGRLRGLVDMRILAGAENSLAELVFEKPSGAALSISAPRKNQGFPLYRESTSLPVFDVLPEGYGYIDIGRLKVGQVMPALEKVRSCPGLVLDMRGYPVGGGMLLGQVLARERTAFARLYFPEFDGATGTFRTREELQYIDPLPGPAFEGPIVMLVHSGTQSAAEHTSLIMEAVRDVTFVGSPSSGADGNITYTVLPGGISVGFTGMGVRHGDGRQLQRMGIQPHVTARPTLSGIRSGRDEVLEKAVEVLRSRTDEPNGGSR